MFYGTDNIPRNIVMDGVLWPKFHFGGELDVVCMYTMHLWCLWKLNYQEEET